MKPEEQSSKEANVPERSSPLKNMDQEQRKFAVLVALAFLIIFLGWLATWQWQSSAERNNTVPTQSFFQNTTQYTKPGIDSLKKTTDSIFRRNNSQDQ
jgi:hypothetical protein